MSYVQGFVVAVPKANKAAYVTSSARAAPLFLEYGALRHIEAWNDSVPDGEVTDFKRAVQATPEEAVVFSWIEWPDKETCDKAAASMETDPRWKDLPEMPFDAKRMIWAGFEPIFDTEAAA